jgi:hypothetical protein
LCVNNQAPTEPNALVYETSTDWEIIHRVQVHPAQREQCPHTACFSTLVSKHRPLLGLLLGKQTQTQADIKFIAQLARWLVDTLLTMESALSTSFIAE